MEVFGAGTNFRSLADSTLMSAAGTVPALKIVEYAVPAGYMVPLSPTNGTADTPVEAAKPGKAVVPVV